MQNRRAHLANFAFCMISMNLSDLYLHLTILLEAICHAVVSKPEILIVMTLHITVYSSRSPSNFTNCASLFVNLAHLGNFVQFSCHQIPFAQKCLALPTILQPTWCTMQLQSYIYCSCASSMLNPSSKALSDYLPCLKKNYLPTMSHKEPPHVRRWLKSFCSSLSSGAGRHEEGEDVLKFIPSSQY